MSALPWLLGLAAGAAVPVHEPPRAVVLVVAPPGVEVRPSPSVWLHRGASWVERHTFVQVRSQEQVGLSDLSLEECPGSRLFSCWTEQALRAAGTGLDFVWVLSFARRGGRAQLRSIWIPAEPWPPEPAAGADLFRDGGPDAEDLRRERAVFDRAWIGPWLPARDPGAVLGRAVDPVRSWLEANGYDRPPAALRLDALPADSRVEVDGRRVLSNAGGSVTLTPILPGTRDVVVETGGRTVERRFELEPATTATWSLPDRRRGGGHPLLWAAAVTAAGAAVTTGIAAATDAPVACLVADRSGDCSSELATAGGHSPGIRVGDGARNAPGVPLAPVALGLGVAAAGAAASAWAFPEFCRERWWLCGLGASLLGTGAGAAWAAAR
jgi:hypothetical protein